MMTLHYLGLRVNGMLVRFEKPVSDYDFEFFRKVGLPEGWCAWHIEGPNDRKLAKVMELPVAHYRIEDGPVHKAEVISTMFMMDIVRYEKWLSYCERRMH